MKYVTHVSPCPGLGEVSKLTKTKRRPLSMVLLQSLLPEWGSPFRSLSLYSILLMSRVIAAC